MSLPSDYSDSSLVQGGVASVVKSYDHNLQITYGKGCCINLETGQVTLPPYVFSEEEEINLLRSCAIHEVSHWLYSRTDYDKIKSLKESHKDNKSLRHEIDNAVEDAFVDKKQLGIHKAYEISYNASWMRIAKNTPENRKNDPIGNALCYLMAEYINKSLWRWDLDEKAKKIYDLIKDDFNLLNQNMTRLERYELSVKIAEKLIKNEEEKNEKDKESNSSKESEGNGESKEIETKGGLRSEFSGELKAIEDKHKLDGDHYTANTEGDCVIKVDNTTKYPAIRDQIAGSSSSLASSIRNHFKSIERVRTAHDLEDGSIDLENKLVDIAKSLSTKVFYKESLGIKQNAAVSILVDLSGSMRGEKIHQARLMTAVLGEVLTCLKIPFEILGHDSGGGPVNFNLTRPYPLRMYIFKLFNETFQSVSGRICNMRENTQNADGEAVEFTFRRLKQRKERNKILFVLSDGLPMTGGRQRDLEHKRLNNAIKTASKHCKVIGIGLCDNNVKLFYPNHILVGDATELSKDVLLSFVNCLQGKNLCQKV